MSVCYIVKPDKNSIFLKKGKTVISVENRKFSRSRMTKRTVPLNLSREIWLPRNVSLNYETIGIFYNFLGDKSSVISGTRFLRKFQKSGNNLG